ncbi:hypothetical protein HanIR_Chr16g0811961 [Helianthus annuus]|nr:hypothetical protein HanIR_Chr16g0811961 [Helianthus annuus]
MAPYNNSLHFQLPILNGKNYYHWSIKMKVLFQSQDLWNIIQNGYEESSSSSNQKEPKELKDKTAPFLIFQTVDDIIFERISVAESSKEAWDTL